MTPIATHNRNTVPTKTPPHGGESVFDCGFSNVILCYIFTLTLALVPISAFFALRYMNPTGKRLYWHYYYIRTTIMLLLLGTSAALLAIAIGARVSSTMVLGGTALLGLLLVWVATRCVYGAFCAARHRPLRDHRSLII